ncbi:CCAAT/enhancer-binding protein epsilon [Hyalella azteca]|uniref:CCAAT/enhancer-binding protein epsilon n=1 Tax=Hyalella azteca TaxID=294128 RepID=A0A8B7N738_HYAAZ|nr:CCAAT/enhancer-binding protein epsilon [Hyalella azteca]
MEAPHLYDSAEYKKMTAAGLKIKGSLSLFSDEYGDLSEFNTSEISLNLNNLIDDTNFSDAHFNEGLISDLQSLNVDKGASPVGQQLNNNGLNQMAPRGLSANPINGNVNMHPNMYNNTYLPQPIHNPNQYERHYHQDQRNIKEEPRDQTAQDYAACARVAYANNNGYGGGLVPYAPMTPVTLPGPDLLKSPLKSPGCLSLSKNLKKNVAPGTEEYRRRRERNNIAVRKSREKAKARSRDTEERVKALSRENEKLHRKCELLSKEVTVLHSVFSQYLPEHVHREVRKQMDSFQQEHQNLLTM